MKRRSIFGSGSERAAFMALRSRWDRQVDVFPQVPVKVVVGFDRIQDVPDENERQYLLETEFDYVICKKSSGVPVLVVEFDGYGGGFSRGLQYETVAAPRDRSRRKKLEAKLRIAIAAEVPMVVVALPETQRVDAAGHLTVLDGIVGEVLASDIFRGELERREFDSVGHAEDLEITLSIKKNPVKAEIARYLAALHFVESAGGMITTQQPQLDREQEQLIGCRTVVMCQGRESEATVYIRDINCAGFTAYGLAEDLSWLAAIREAAHGAGIALPDPGAAQQ